MTQKKLWKAERGEWYLLVQAALILLLLFGPSTFPGMPVWDAAYSRLASLSGVALIFTGILLATSGVISLGRNLTPLPVPKKNGALVVHGAYRIVRHPIYSGLLFMAVGWGFWLNSWLTIGYALLLFVFFDVKSRYEEHLLGEKFEEYAAYRKRVRKLLPFIY